MREINMQKRMEHENGGIDAVVSLLRINEMNAANLDRITESNAANLETVRQDIAKLVTRINTEAVNKKKNNVKDKLQAVAEMVKLGHQLHEEEKAKDGIPKRSIDMNKAQLHMSRSYSPSRQELLKHTDQISEQPDGIYKDGHGRPILDPFHPSLGKPDINENNENTSDTQSHGAKLLAEAKAGIGAETGAADSSLSKSVQKVAFVPQTQGSSASQNNAPSVTKAGKR